MTWDEVLTRLEDSGLNPVEVTYMENYGKILAAQRPEFRDRNFRCTLGLVNCDGIDLEVFLFPNETHRSEFMEVIGTDPWWLALENAVLHFPECDPAKVMKILGSIAS